MIQFNESLADAYVMPSRNVALPSAPGRTVRFLQGHAVIKDGRDMVAMMKRPGVKLVLTPYAMSWIETWLSAVGENARAEILMPETPVLDPPAPESSWDPSMVKVVRGTDSTEPDPGIG